MSWILIRELEGEEILMNTNQFEQLINAILAGKYSWACVLILRFYGRNPLDYIPYRTYYRLIRDNDCNYT
jgi:hypothetical protein